MHLIWQSTRICSAISVRRTHATLWTMSPKTSWRDKLFVISPVAVPAPMKARASEMQCSMGMSAASEERIHHAMGAFLTKGCGVPICRVIACVHGHFRGGNLSACRQSRVTFLSGTVLVCAASLLCSTKQEYNETIPPDCFEWDDDCFEWDGETRRRNDGRRVPESEGRASAARHESTD